MTDPDLLRHYVEHADQSAFAEVVRRHVNWVNSMARRVVRDEALAADVTQAVFVLLSRRARSLVGKSVLSTWLFNVTRYTSLNAVRMEARRRKHERIAAAMRAYAAPVADPSKWDDLVEIVDELVHKLGRSDREAVLLRFYEQKSFDEIGTAMRISEEAARKRVTRAVEQLRGLFSKRGISVPATALGVMMTNQMAQPASAAVIGSATAAAQGGTAAISVSSLVQASGNWLFLMGLKPAAVAVAALCFVGATVALVMQATSQAPPAMAQAPAMGPGRFGRLVSPDDRPVAGARIYLTEYDTYLSARAIDSTTSDAGGLFRFRKVEASAGMINEMIAHATGYGLTVAGMAVEGEEPVDAQFKPATELRVRFVGPDGQPVQGLRVHIERVGQKRLGNSATLPQELREQLAQTTDNQGACVFPGMPQDGFVWLGVSDERYARLTNEQRIITGESATTQGGVVRLAQTATISGRVFYPDDGRPLPGVRVIATSSPQDRAEDGFGTAITDADGKYLIKQMVPGTYDMGVRLPQEVISQHAAAMRIDVRATPGIDTPNQDFVLVPGAIIRGRVVIKGTNKPVPQMSIGVYSPGNWQARGWLSGTNTKEDGTYMLHVPPGTQHVYVSQTPPPGLLETQPKGYDLTLAGGQTATADFVFPEDPSPGVKGRVVDTDGKPVKGAVVIATRPDHRLPIGGTSYGHSDADGSFNIPTVSSGSTLRASRGRWITTETVTVNDEHRNLTLVLHKDALASVLVRVKLPDGSPAVGTKVDLIERAGQFGLGTDNKRTGPEGTALFKNLDPTKKYHFSAGGFGFGTNQSQEMDVQAGKQNEVTISVPRADSLVGGIVLDTAGQPAIDVEIHASGRQSRHQSTRTDVTGRFAFNDIVAGDVIRVWTRVQNQNSPDTRIEAGKGDAVIMHNLPEAPARP